MSLQGLLRISQRSCRYFIGTVQKFTTYLKQGNVRAVPTKEKLILVWTIPLFADLFRYAWGIAPWLVGSAMDAYSPLLSNILVYV